MRKIIPVMVSSVTQQYNTMLGKHRSLAHFGLKDKQKHRLIRRFVLSILTRSFSPVITLKSTIRMGHHNRHYAGDPNSLNGAWSAPNSRAKCVKRVVSIMNHII